MIIFKWSIFLGVNIKSNQIFFTANIYSGLAAGGTIASPTFNYIADFFVIYDFVLVIQDGVASVGM
jgi:hypothetical protein